MQQRNNNRPVVPPMAQAARAQAAAHAGQRFHLDQRVHDLVSKRDGRIAEIGVETNSDQLFYLVDLEVPAVIVEHGRDATREPIDATKDYRERVQRKQSELSEIPESLRCDVADLENPRL